MIKRINNFRGELNREEMERGRGGDYVSPAPVALEPVFKPFSYGRSERQAESYPTEPEYQNEESTYSQVQTLCIRPCREGKWQKDLAEQLLVSLTGQLSFELLCRDGRVACQMAAAPELILSTKGILSTLYPETEAYESEDHLSRLANGQILVSGYRLKVSHFFPLRNEFKSDPFNTLLGGFASLNDGQFGMLQVIFSPVYNGWRDNILLASRSEYDQGKSAFYDLPDLHKSAEKKVSQPLYAVSLRLVGSSEEVIERLVPFLNLFESNNGFVPVAVSYPGASAVQRTVHATGMLLNAEEMACLVHVPGLDGATSILEVATPETLPPEYATKDTIVTLGTNTYHGLSRDVGISEEMLTRHVAIFGATGTGKTTLLLRFAALTERGYGMSFIDPHGDAAETFLDLIPGDRVKDCIYFNPGDRDFPPALNVLESSSERENQMLCSDLLVSFARLFQDAWGPRMEWILRQCINTLLYSDGKYSLRDINKLLFNEQFREQVVSSITDPDILSFWSDSFPKLPRNSLDPIINKNSKFLDNPVVRNIVAQPNLIDFQEIVRNNKIFVANLSKGILGEDIAFLLGSFILSKLQIAAMSRAETAPRERKLFTIVIDEFQNYASDATNTASIMSLLSEARKYKVSLVLATQFLSQLHKDVIATIFGNVGTLVAFRCGIQDAQFLSKEFGRYKPEDITNLGILRSLVRMLISRTSFSLGVNFSNAVGETYKKEIIDLTRQLCCRPRQEVEKMIWQPAPTKASRRKKEEATELDFKPGNCHKDFITCLATHPGFSVTQIYSELGLSAYMGNRLKNELIKAGFISELITNLGRGSRVAKFLVPTSKASGEIAIGDIGGRGSALHKFIQSLVKSLGERSNYTATIEAQVSESGQCVDVLLVDKNRKVGIEISLFSKPDYEVNNIKKCLATDMDQVIVVFLETNQFTKVTELAQSTLEASDLKRVCFCFLNDLGSLL
jgi:hypothetical protein